MNKTFDPGCLRSLLKKYGVPGPRYTSYPAQPDWSGCPSPDRWIASLAESLEAALYVHIPFCESLCSYCGCNTKITRRHELGDLYVDTILREWSLYRERLGAKLRLSGIHLGGGTPTFLS